MSLLDAYEDQFKTAATALPLVPSTVRRDPKFTTWSAAPRGLAAGAAESAGFWSEVVGAFGQVAGAYPEALGVTPTPEQRKQADEARRKLLTGGIDWSSDTGDLFRGVAAGYKADPETAGLADQILFGFAKFAGKAVGYSVAGGPAVGAVLTGADEGMAASDALRLQGVDESTRTKVGALAGAAAGLGVALPVVGRSALETTGLVLAGGPGAFSAQQAATRYILENADYSTLAEQYDPFDPVGLAVATLVPAGFGAWGLRRARVDGKPAPTPEQVDAARVALQAEQRQASDVTPGDLLGMQAHEAALVKTEQQLAAGEAPTAGAGVPLGPAGVKSLSDLQARIAEALESPAFVRARDGGPVGDNFITDRFIAEVNREVTHFDAQKDIESRAQKAAERTIEPSPVSSIEVLRTGREPDATRETSPADQAAARRQQRLTQMQAELPDLFVRADDMDEAVPLKDFLAKVQREADELEADAPLFELAAQCALLNPSA